MFAAPLATQSLRRSPSSALPVAHPASPVQRALDDSPRVTAQRAVAARLARRGAGGVVQREGNGLAEPEAIAAYTLPLAEQLAKAGLGDRVALLRNAINGVLTKAGVPPVEIKILDHGGSAEFDEKTWTMGLLGASVETADPGVLAELVGTVYHEARHAEQFYRVAQQAAAAEDELGLHRLKLPDRVRLAAVESKGEFAKLGEATRKATTEWAESLKNPVSVLDEMEEAGRALAFRVEAYQSAMGALMGAVGILRTNLAMGSFGGAVVAKAQEALERQRSERFRVRGALLLYQDALVAYRRLPHEADAHALGWTVEDTFRTGAPVGGYDPTHANRIPKDDPIWASLHQIDGSLDGLGDLLAALQKAASSTSLDQSATTTTVDADEFLDLEETVEERAAAVAKMIVAHNKAASYEEEYQKALEELQKSESTTVNPSDLTPLTGWQQLAMLSDALGQWLVVEPRYLSALSASVHRRTNI